MKHGAKTRAPSDPSSGAGGSKQIAQVAIKAQGLIKDYGSGGNLVHALRGVDVEFERGRFTVIMGPSGSGKSTLMHTLAGLDTATSGHVYLNGADAERVKGRRASRHGGQRGWST